MEDMIDVLGLLAQQKARLQEWQQGIRALEEDVRALEHTVSLNQRLRPKRGGVPTMNTATPIDLAQLREQRTQKDALYFIARQNKGHVKVKDAVPLMIQAGKVKGESKHAYRHLYGILANDERYTPMGEALFQLKEEFARELTGEGVVT